MATANDGLRLPAARPRLRHRLLHQLYRHVLPRLPGHPLWYHGGRVLHLYIRHPALESGGDCAREESGREPRLSLQVQYTTTQLCLSVCPFVLILCLCLSSFTCKSICLSVLTLFQLYEKIFRVNAVPRPIPEKKWFMEPLIIIMLGGILPFGSIFIEMYFIFTSFWAYKIYYVYGFMLLGNKY